MRAIVTGANGFIGSNLIKKLVDNNIEVTAIDISFNPSRLEGNKLIKKIETSIDKLSTSMLDGEYDLFFHFAWGGCKRLS
jgi:UDP-glucose 4-epimerase